MRTLRTWRNETKTTLAELAARVGVGKGFVSEVERGLKRPSAEVARKIESATNGAVTAAELLGVSVRAGFSEATKRFTRSDDPALLQEAASYGLDAEEIARSAVERAVKTERMKRFSEENREAIESWNALVEREGLWSDGYRAF